MYKCKVKDMPRRIGIYKKRLLKLLSQIVILH